MVRHILDEASEFGGVPGRHSLQGCCKAVDRIMGQVCGANRRKLNLSTIRNLDGLRNEALELQRDKHAGCEIRFDTKKVCKEARRP